MENLDVLLRWNKMLQLHEISQYKKNENLDVLLRWNKMLQLHEILNIRKMEALFFTRDEMSEQHGTK
jgi:hypothetical protein